MTDKNCRACHGSSLEPFLDLGDMPLAGGFLAGSKAAAEEKFYPLEIFVCLDCALVQIIDPVDPEILFKDYSFSSSTVGPLVQHFESYAGWLKDHFAPTTVVEFGSNDGILLEPLERQGIQAAGIDISDNITEIARGKGLDTVTGYFTPQLAEQLRDRLGPVDVVTGSNAFAHNADPGVILEATNILLASDGHLCLEVMYAGDLLEQLQWDTLYHEHLTFYSLTTLQRLLQRFGLHIVDAERIGMHGGSLRIAASPSQTPPSVSMEDILAYEAGVKLNDPMTWKEFGAGISRKIDIVRDTLSRLHQTSRIWGYGAAGKATLWVNACNLTFLEAMVDASPLRAGKLMPGTHTPIVFPEKLKENPPDYIFITAWNYAGVIRANEEWFDGIWITPLPDLRMF